MSTSIAIDLGSSTGRLIKISKMDDKLSFEVLTKFDNKSEISSDGHLHWDFEGLRSSIRKAMEELDVNERTSVSVDSWGVDYALLDEDSGSFPQPFHYRDSRTDNMPEWLVQEKGISYEELYSQSGLQIMSINTIYQLLTEKERKGTVLLTPDLVLYLLSGKLNTEMSIASTTGLIDPRTKNWNRDLISRIGLDGFEFKDVNPTFRILGPSTIRDDIEVISGLGHDTAAAIAAVPNKEKDFLFISSGSWSLLGTVLDEPITDEKAARYNLTNEICYDGKISFLKNITGLWILQELRRDWNSTFSIMEEEAKKATPFLGFIDTDDPRFEKPGHMEEKIREYLRETGQPQPEGIGGITRCVNESLAMKYRLTRRQVENCTGKHYSRLYIIGGGSRSALLCQMTSSALDLPATLGPVEATSYGNALAQFIAKGEIKDIDEAKSIIRKLDEIKEITPFDPEEWDKHYPRYLNVTHLHDF